MQGIGRYRASRLESAPPQQIVLMLFQEAARRLTLAADAIARNDGTVWRPHLHHVREIFLELLSALDDDAAPELCANLRSLYRWCIHELVTAGRTNSAQCVLNVLSVTNSLLEGWQGALNSDELTDQKTG